VAGKQAGGGLRCGWWCGMLLRAPARGKRGTGTRSEAAGVVVCERARRLGQARRCGGRHEGRPGWILQQAVEGKCVCWRRSSVLRRANWSPGEGDAGADETDASCALRSRLGRGHQCGRGNSADVSLSFKSQHGSTCARRRAARSSPHRSEGSAAAPRSIEAVCLSGTGGPLEGRGCGDGAANGMRFFTHAGGAVGIGPCLTLLRGSGGACDASRNANKKEKSEEAVGRGAVALARAAVHSCALGRRVCAPNEERAGNGRSPPNARSSMERERSVCVCVRG
jgi:hypothetical protein